MGLDAFLKEKLDNQDRALSPPVKASPQTYMVLAKSKHQEKALHIGSFTLTGTVQYLHTAHYAYCGVVA